MLAQHRQRRAVEVGVRVVEREHHRPRRHRGAGLAAGQLGGGHRLVARGRQELHLGGELGRVDGKAPELAGGVGGDAVVHQHGHLARGAVRARAHRPASARACLRTLLM